MHLEEEEEEHDEPSGSWRELRYWVRIVRLVASCVPSQGLISPVTLNGGGEG